VRFKIDRELVSALFSGRVRILGKKCVSLCGKSLECSEQTDDTVTAAHADGPHKTTFPTDQPAPGSHAVRQSRPHSLTQQGGLKMAAESACRASMCRGYATLVQITTTSTACTSAVATPVDPADPIEKANQAFVAGDYQGALALWTSALSSGELRTGVLALGCTQRAQRVPWIPAVCCLPLTACSLPRAPLVLQSATSTIMLCTPTAELRWSAWDRSRKRSRCAQLAAALPAAALLVLGFVATLVSGCSRRLSHNLRPASALRCICAGVR
jgi:hypothetical protein